MLIYNKLIKLSNFHLGKYVIRYYLSPMACSATPLRYAACS